VTTISDLAEPIWCYHPRQFTGVQRPQLPKIFANKSASGLQPTIERHPRTASRRDIPPTYQTRDCAQFRAIGIASATSNYMRGCKPCGYDRQRPRNRRNRHTEKNPRQREPCDTGGCSRHPLTDCDCPRRTRIFANRALGAVCHLHGHCLTQSVYSLRSPFIVDPRRQAEVSIQSTASQDLECDCNRQYLRRSQGNG